MTKPRKWALRAAPTGQYEKHLTVPDFSKLMNLLPWLTSNFPSTAWFPSTTPSQISTAPTLPAAGESQASRDGHFQSKQPCSPVPGARTPEAAVPGNQQEADKWVVLESSITLSSGGSYHALRLELLLSEGNWGEKRKPPAFSPKSPAFCACTLVPSGTLLWFLTQWRSTDGP